MRLWGSLNHTWQGSLATLLPAWVNVLWKVYHLNTRSRHDRACLPRCTNILCHLQVNPICTVWSKCVFMIGMSTGVVRQYITPSSRFLSRCHLLTMLDTAVTALMRWQVGAYLDNCSWVFLITISWLRDGRQKGKAPGTTTTPGSITTSFTILRKAGLSCLFSAHQFIHVSDFKVLILLLLNLLFVPAPPGWYLKSETFYN